VQAADTAMQRIARFMNKDSRQMSFYSAAVGFRFWGRLTDFQLARRIVCIRTICPVARNGV
jgi:hypothetical protein